MGHALDRMLEFARDEWHRVSAAVVGGLVLALRLMRLAKKIDSAANAVPVRYDTPPHGALEDSRDKELRAMARELAEYQRRCDGLEVRIRASESRLREALGDLEKALHDVEQWREKAHEFALEIASLRAARGG